MCGVTIITGRNEVVAKVIFLHPVCHSVHRGGVCLGACWDTTPPQEQTPPPPWSRHAPLGADIPRSRHPREQTPPRSRHPSPQSRHAPPKADTPSQKQTTPTADTPPKSRLRHMVNEQPVCILLECILVRQAAVNFSVMSALSFPLP